VSKPPNTESRFGWRNLLTGHAAILLLMGAVVAAVLSGSTGYCLQGTMADGSQTRPGSVAHNGYALGMDMIAGHRIHWNDWGIDSEESANHDRNYLSWTGHGSSCGEPPGVFTGGPRLTGLPNGSSIDFRSVIHRSSPPTPPDVPGRNLSPLDLRE
jgi:hypothetical protein